jgi:hypothetical protein
LLGNDEARRIAANIAKLPEFDLLMQMERDMPVNRLTISLMHGLG